MSMMTKTSVLALAAGAILGSTAVAYAEGELNLYSSRHCDTDERLYSDFTDATGITINVLPFPPPATHRLEGRIPGNLQDADNQWFGFSQRARIIFYDKTDVTEPPMSYVDLADPKFEGQVCHRSSTNVYSQTLLSAVIQNHGVADATEWAQGLVNNFARDPQGGDTDQLRGLVSGECDISISNTYYFARAIRTDVDGLAKADMENIGWVFPSQDAEGAHMNLSGGGVAANAPNRDNAVLFLEYLASDQAQQYFSAGNDEYPAVPGVGLSPAVAARGMFRPDAVDLTKVAKNVPAAQNIFNEVGWE